MSQVVYAMQFKGAGEPTGEENVLQATTSAASSRICSSVGSSGLSSQIEANDGNAAQFELEVRLTGGTSFT